MVLQCEDVAMLVDAVCLVRGGEGEEVGVAGAPLQDRPFGIAERRRALSARWVAGNEQ